MARALAELLAPPLPERPRAGAIVPSNARRLADEESGMVHAPFFSTHVREGH